MCVLNDVFFIILGSFFYFHAVFLAPTVLPQAMTVNSILSVGASNFNEGIFSRTMIHHDLILEKIVVEVFFSLIDNHTKN